MTRQEIQEYKRLLKEKIEKQKKSEWEAFSGEIPISLLGYTSICISRHRNEYLVELLEEFEGLLERQETLVKKPLTIENIFTRPILGWKITSLKEKITQRLEPDMVERVAVAA